MTTLTNRLAWFSWIPGRADLSMWNIICTNLLLKPRGIPLFQVIHVMTALWHEREFSISLLAKLKLFDKWRVCHTMPCANAVIFDRKQFQSFYFYISCSYSPSYLRKWLGCHAICMTTQAWVYRADGREVQVFVLVADKIRQRESQLWIVYSSATHYRTSLCTSNLEILSELILHAFQK